MKQKFNVTGMSCSACSANIEKTLLKQSGVEKAEVNLLSNSMQVSYDENIISEAQIIKAVETIGYGASVPGKAADSAPPEDAGVSEEKSLLHRFVISACFACAADVYFNVSYVLRVVRSADSGVYDGAVSRR